MAKSKYQSYDTETISRDMIKNAPYNPRIMDEKAKKRLRANIAKHGLVAALTWNKRTGNLVGGIKGSNSLTHWKSQRIMI